MRERLRGLVTAGFFSLLAAIFVGVIVQWFIQVATDKGWYSHAGAKWDRLVSAAIFYVTSPWATHLLALLGGLTLGFWGDVLLIRRERERASARLEEVRGRVFANEIVDLDGKHFIRCEFKSVRLRYAGGHFGLTNNNFDGNPIIEPLGDQLINYTKILAEFGKLSQPVATPDGRLITNTITQEHSGSGDNEINF